MWKWLKVFVGTLMILLMIGGSTAAVVVSAVQYKTQREALQIYVNKLQTMQDKIEKLQSQLNRQTIGPCM